MDAFGLGPLPQGWEAKIEPKNGRIYFINHPAKSTTWSDPRLQLISPPSYELALSHNPAYFEDNGGSRWSPVPSLRAFTLGRRGSSPRLSGSPRIAPISQDLEGRIETPRRQVVLGGQEKPRLSPPAATTTSLIPEAAPRLRSASIGPGPATNLLAIRSNELLPERPQSAKSFSSVSTANFLGTCDTETALRLVCEIFPTADEPHIKHLFHKYYNRPALVISALQVEKHPYSTEIANQLELKLSGRDVDDAETIASVGETRIHSPFKTNSFTTGSPARTGTPVSLFKFSNNPSTTGSIHTRWGSPLLSMSPQLQMVKEESQIGKSPGMKVKYMKGTFPAADELFLADVLASCDDNIQKATQKLLQKGFTRTPPAKPARHKLLEIKQIIEKRNKALEQQKIVNDMQLAMSEVESPFPTPIMKTARPHVVNNKALEQQRGKVKDGLIKRFPHLPERFVFWAAEAAKFELEKASRLLQEVGPETPEEFKPFVVSSPVNDALSASRMMSRDDDERRVVRFAETHAAGLPFGKLDEFKVTDVDTPDSGYFEIEGRGRKKNFITSFFGSKTEKEKEYVKSSKIAKGPNSSLVRGPNPSHLLPNYLAINGPSSLQKGPQASNRTASSGLAMGHNPKLAKGSMWANKKNSLNTASTLHHVTVGV